MKPIVFIFLTLLLPATASAFCFEEAGIEYGISPLLLRSIAQHESGMNPVGGLPERQRHLRLRPHADQLHLGQGLGDGTLDEARRSVHQRQDRCVDPCTMHAASRLHLEGGRLLPQQHPGKERTIRRPHRRPHGKAGPVERKPDPDADSFDAATRPFLHHLER